MSQPAILNIVLEGAGGRKGALSVDLAPLAAAAGIDSPVVAGTPAVADDTELYVVGQANETGIHEIVGVFSDPHIAAQHATTPEHFIGPVKLNQAQPAGPEWPDILWPLKKS